MFWYSKTVLNDILLIKKLLAHKCILFAYKLTYFIPSLLSIFNFTRLKILKKLGNLKKNCLAYKQH